MLDSAFLFLSLVAGAGVDFAPAWGGAVAFDVGDSSLWAFWDRGSAYNFDMLLAGAAAVYTPAVGGAFTFNEGILPTNAWWGNGSAIYR